MSQQSKKNELEDGEIEEDVELTNNDLEEGEIEEPNNENPQLEEQEQEQEQGQEQNSEKEQPNNDSKESEILLKLGDIILITDPTNEILNNNVFLIEYIDPTKMKLINSETFEKVVLPISTDGLIGDGSIQTIKVISSNPKEGYAKQNDLLPGTWINIYFGGEVPTIITGKITNLEKDCCLQA